MKNNVLRQPVALDLAPTMTRRAFLADAALAGLSVLAGLFAIAMGGCKLGSGSSTAGNTSSAGSGSNNDTNSVIVALFDVSASTQSATVKQRYFDGFQHIVTSTKGGSLLSGYAITSVTQATSTIRIDQMIPTYSASQNTDQYNSDCATAQNEALDQARTLLNLRTAEATDILGAFNDAAGIIDGHKGMTPKLVIFSDMVHQSGRYDFAREDLTRSRTQAIIHAQRQAGLLPTLTGVEVWVAGATADPSDLSARHANAQPSVLLDPDKIAQIRAFWIAFFDACGASLTSDRYSATLQNYEG